MKLEDTHLAVIGLGYVGLPLAAEFATKFPVIGFDINPVRVEELRQGIDRTNELNPEELQAATHLSVTDNPDD
ncbi:MAG TPA: Vi polysaccharide biosynthesis UDP-N-acetylglucosamine C-6 dehydrogenase TviB, partial [Beutenbergiaceae bacterium]|nr:Vi polysaccharide biosynthesis UDP-N-acetylglucosamine C-6 dehydrogenase TviB [Beutenbergiaceae bacterium]